MRRTRARRCAWSRPSRTRGLKQRNARARCTPVASRPSRTRGLKLALLRVRERGVQVASFADVWVETSRARRPRRHRRVASLADVWVETSTTTAPTRRRPPRPSRTRGSKLHPAPSLRCLPRRVLRGRGERPQPVMDRPEVRLSRRTPTASASREHRIRTGGARSALPPLAAAVAAARTRCRSRRRQRFS